MDDLDPRDRDVARLLAELPVTDDPATFERVRLAYLSSRTARRSRRRLYRHGMRLATVAAVSALSGSLAAGYAAALPDPVQRAAHHIFGRVGIPAPQHHRAQAPVHETPRPSPSTIRAHRVVVPPRPAALSRPHAKGPRLHFADHGREPAGSTTIAWTTVDTVHTPQSFVRVQLATSRSGPWHKLLTAMPDRGGRASFTLPAFPHNMWLRVVEGHQLGTPQLLVVLPTMTAQWSRGTDGHESLRLTVRGVAPGETVTVTTTGKDRHTTTIHRPLGHHGVVTFTFAVAPAPGSQLLAAIAATSRHGATTIAVTPPSGR